MKLKRDYIHNALLLVAGTLLILVGASITLSPANFYAANGISVGANVNLLNELKAPAGMLVFAGLFMLGALFLRRLADPALWLATLIYLSYAFARLLSIVIDGVPVRGLVAAGMLEAIIGLTCLAALMLGYRTKTGAPAAH